MLLLLAPILAAFDVDLPADIVQNLTSGLTSGNAFSGGQAPPLPAKTHYCTKEGTDFESNDGGCYNKNIQNGTIVCIAPHTCKAATLVAEASVQCRLLASCYETTMTSNDQVDCTGRFSCARAKITAKSSIHCGLLWEYGSCVHTELSTDGHIGCEGKAACYNAMFTKMNSISCAGEDACFGEYPILADGDIECNKDRACASSIDTGRDIVSKTRLTCVGKDACDKTRVTTPHIYCKDEDSCLGIVLVSSDPRGLTYHCATSAGCGVLKYSCKDVDGSTDTKYANLQYTEWEPKVLCGKSPRVVTPSPVNAPVEKTSSNVGVIVGSVMGGLALVAIIVGVVCAVCFWTKKQRHPQPRGNINAGVL